MSCGCPSAGNAIRGAAAIAKTVDGVGLATGAVIAARRSKCKKCGHHVLGVCEICFCIIAIKTARADEKCPDEPPKW